MIYDLTSRIYQCEQLMSRRTKDSHVGRGHGSRTLSYHTQFLSLLAEGWLGWRAFLWCGLRNFSKTSKSVIEVQEQHLEASVQRQKRISFSTLSTTHLRREMHQRQFQVKEIDYTQLFSKELHTSVAMECNSGRTRLMRSCQLVEKNDSTAIKPG
jgi:hypothetical protein